MMRAFVFRLAVLLGLGAGAGPAVAQALRPPPPPAAPAARPDMLSEARAGQLRAQMDWAGRQAVIQQNDLSRLEGQVRTEQNLANLQAQGVTPQIPPPPENGVRNIDVSGLASMPDDELAASNARVKAAAENRP
jgi:hypothetical protein